MIELLAMYVFVAAPAGAVLILAAARVYDWHYRRRLNERARCYLEGFNDGLEVGRIEGMRQALHARRSFITSQRQAGMEGRQ